MHDACRGCRCLSPFGDAPITTEVAAGPRLRHLFRVDCDRAARRGSVPARNAAREPAPRPPMRYINPLLFLLLVILGVKLTDSLYHWVAFGPERAQVKVLRTRLVDAGAQYVRTRQEGDSMRAVL